MYKNKAEADAAKLARENAPKDNPKVIYNKKTGMPSGIVFPDGREYLDRTPSEIGFLARKYAPVPGTQDYNKPPMPEAPLPQETPKPLISEAQKSMVGTGQPNFVSTPSTAEDELTKNIKEQNRLASVAGTSPESVINAAELGFKLGGVPGAAATGLLQASGIRGSDILGIIPGGVGKRLATTITGNNADLSNYINNYSNEGNFASVKGNLENADKEIDAAIISASDPAQTQKAIYAYEEAMNKKRRSIEQLKLIASRNQGEYISSVKDELTTLQTYFDSQMKANDDAAMRAAIDLANKRYLERMMLEGVANG